MKLATALLGILVVWVSASPCAKAQETDKKAEAKTAEGTPGPSPEEVTVGEIRLQVTSDYPKLLVDGEVWEEHEFLNSGKLLILHGMKRTEAHQLTLTPIYRELSPVELTVKPEDWKLATVGKNVKMWRFEGKITFQKGLKTPPPKEVPQKASPMPEPPPVPPPTTVTPTPR